MTVTLKEAYLQLEEPDFRVLRVIEKWLPKYEYVPAEVLERHARLPPSALSRSLRKLGELKLVRRTLGSLIGYTLTFMGLDVLALRGLVVRGVVEEIGEKIGVGKEGNVYLAVAPSGERVVVKFHREGRRSFKHLRRARSFMAEASRGQWLLKAKMLGEREFKILVELSSRGARVPKPLGWNRNAVVQAYLEGVELYRLKAGGLERGQAERILWDVLETVRTAYRDVGIVHGDLSEYNVLVAVEDGEYRGYVIDWPQYVYREEEHAEDLLKRDVYYVVRFFRKNFGVDVSEEEALSFVKG
ncbi:RIO1 family regulatory kinase/ATPase domain-containing protein [Stetteria hydrogenophila]